MVSECVLSYVFYSLVLHQNGVLRAHMWRRYSLSHSHQSLLNAIGSRGRRLGSLIDAQITLQKRHIKLALEKEIRT